MNFYDDLRSFTLRAAYGYATARQLHFRVAFGDTLAGDLARLQIFRSLRRRFPTEPRSRLTGAIEELLTP